MSKIHVLESDGNFGYRLAIHFATATGNNSVGLSWKSCALASGLIGSTSLEVGTDPGDIAQAEYDSIIAGDTIEIVATVAPGVAPTNAAVNALADVEIATFEARVTRELKYYGHTIG